MRNDTLRNNKKRSEKQAYDMRSIFPYVGGKHRVAPRLIKWFAQHNCYVELFAGAANVLLAKEPSKVEVLNDVNGDLVNIFRVIRWHPDELVRELAFITHSRQEFMDYHEQKGLTDVQRAARHWFKLRATFGGKGPTGQKYFAIATDTKSMTRNIAFETIRQVHERLDGVFIENDDFEKVIKRYDRNYTLFFCDPPYWQATGYYGVPFEWSDQERLAKCLRKIKGKFLLTINDHPAIKKLYRGLHIRRVKVCYTVCRCGVRKSYELIIANYPLPKRW